MNDETNVLKLPERATEEPAWICGCGAFNWILYANGDCLCVGCNHISTVIKVYRAGGTAKAFVPKKKEGTDHVNHS